MSDYQSHRVEQTSALAKYGTIWKRYEAFYDNMEQVHDAKQKKEELQSLERQSKTDLVVQCPCFDQFVHASNSHFMGLWFSL